MSTCQETGYETNKAPQSDKEGTNLNAHLHPATPHPLFHHLDHIGVVVHSLDESLKTYCDLMGFTLLERLTVPEHGIEVAFLDAGNSTLELLAPTDSQSGTARFLQNRGEGAHHVCFVVEDIRAALAQLQAQGLRLIDETPRQGIHGLIAFVHPKATHGVMIELLQRAEH